MATLFVITLVNIHSSCVRYFSHFDVSGNLHSTSGVSSARDFGSFEIAKFVQRRIENELKLIGDFDDYHVFVEGLNQDETPLGIQSQER
jgi:hypothetical protein